MRHYLLERILPVDGQPMRYVVQAETAKHARRYLVEHERYQGYVLIDRWLKASTSTCTPIKFLVDPGHDQSRR